MSRVAVVTGANQGLGLALVRGLCRQLGEQGIVYLTARNCSRGEEAVRQLQEEGLSPRFHLLDVSDDHSVAAFAETIKKQHNGVDIVISNAAGRISPVISQSQQVAEFINTNNHGTYRIMKAFSPLLNNGARFISVASSFGSLSHLPSHLHEKFNIMKSNLEDIESVMDDYVQLIESDQAAQQGWPTWINVPSKIGQVASVKIMARMLMEEAERKDILVNAVCPGLIDTEASRPWFSDMSSAKSPDQAAIDVLHLALLPKGAKEPYGELVQHGCILTF